MNWNGLGVALGAATNEWNKQRDMDRADEQLAMQKEQLGFQRDEHKWKTDDQARRQKMQGDQDAILSEMRELEGLRGLIDNTPDDQLHTVAQKIADKYNTHPLYNNGAIGGITTINGKPMIVHGTLGKNDAQVIPLTRESLGAGLTRLDDMIARRLAMASGAEGFQQYRAGEREYGLKNREVSTKEEANRINDRYRQDTVDMQRNSAQFANDGTGRVLAFSRDGKLLGTYGAARPVLGLGGGAGGPKHDWAPLGTDSDGTPVFLDKKQFDPTKPGAGFIRSDGKPVRDLQTVYRKFTAAPNVVAPEAQKEYRAALVQLGPRPAPKSALFGGTKNQSQIDAWDAAAAHLREVYGVADPSLGQGPNGAPVLQPPPSRTRPNVDLSQTAPQRSSALPARRPGSVLDGAGLNYNDIYRR